MLLFPDKVLKQTWLLTFNYWLNHELNFTIFFWFLSFLSYPTIFSCQIGLPVPQNASHSSILKSFLTFCIHALKGSIPDFWRKSQIQLAHYDSLWGCHMQRTDRLQRNTQRNYFNSKHFTFTSKIIFFYYPSFVLKPWSNKTKLLSLHKKNIQKCPDRSNVHNHKWALRCSVDLISIHSLECITGVWFSRALVFLRTNTKQCTATLKVAAPCSYVVWRIPRTKVVMQS